MLKTYRFRIYPSPDQERTLVRHLGAMRFIYNWGLELAVKEYRATGKGFSFADLSRRLPGLKTELAWLGEVPAQSLQQALRNLDRAFTGFYRGQAQLPRFKRKRNSASMRYAQDVRVEWEKELIRLPRVGWVPIRLSQRFSGVIKSTTISRVPSGKFFVAILVEDENQVPQPTPESIERAVGCDLGLHDFAVLSSGEKYPHPQWLEAELSRLRMLQRRMDKKETGSRNWEKARHRLAVLHERIANRRRDYIHKLSTDLIRRFDTICLEDLNVGGMSHLRKLSRRITYAGWGMFRHQLEYKAAWSGKTVRIIGRFAPTSRVCPCGYYNHAMTLADRRWECPACGTLHDRDILAANNIKRFAFS